MSSDTIGIVGSRGAVGCALARRLRDLGFRNLRLGSRPAQEALADHRAGLLPLEVYDAEQLSRFCRGCRIVVNCAGPSSRILDRVARAAVAAGADYVDPGGDEVLAARLAGVADANGQWRAVISSGMVPGLTGLLPRWLARQDRGCNRRLTAYVCVRDRFTPAAAIDYLLSLRSGYGEGLAAWRSGRRVSRALTPLTGISLPFFAGRVNAYPYLTNEAERLARSFGLDEVAWYTIFDGEHMWAALARFSDGSTRWSDVTAAEQIYRAAELDLFGRPPRQTLVFSLETELEGRPLGRTLLMHASSTYEVTSAVAAMAVSALLKGRIPPGAHFGADVLDVDGVVDYLRETTAETSFEIIDRPNGAAYDTDEGPL